MLCLMMLVARHESRSSTLGLYYVKTSELSESEKAEFRSLIGQLGWIATYTRPNVAFDVCDLRVDSSKAIVSDV